ncbi:Spore germination B3/ GerAC like protein [Brevibacillus sp. IT-7CA2]
MHATWHILPLNRINPNALQILLGVRDYFGGEIEKEAAKKIEAEIRRLYEKGRKQQMDTLQLGHTLYRKYPQEWKRMQQNGALPLQPSSLGAVNVKVTIHDGEISKVKQVR